MKTETKGAEMEHNGMVKELVEDMAKHRPIEEPEGWEPMPLKHIVDRLERELDDFVIGADNGQRFDGDDDQLERFINETVPKMAEFVKVWTPHRKRATSDTDDRS